MPLDSDVAVLGTGVAPLVAANHLLAQGKSVLLLNPDRDFYLEDSELALDPMLPAEPTAARLAEASPERAIETLRPDYPGAVESWPPGQGRVDPDAPRVRARARLWINPPGATGWERLEELYVEASDRGLNPSVLEGLASVRRFPGCRVPPSDPGASDFRGLLVPKSCDVDVTRYRNGLLEFVRERLGPERVVCGASQIENMPEGIRFHGPGGARTARLAQGLVVFWTPRLTPWVLAQAKRAEIVPLAPHGIRVWERWSLVSREPIDPGVIGMYRGPQGDLAVWGEEEGAAKGTLTALRAGPLVKLDALSRPRGGIRWATADSFDALAALCRSFLGWDRIAVRAMRPRAIFEWGSDARVWNLGTSVKVVPLCDGPLVDVVRASRAACEARPPEAMR